MTPPSFDLWQCSWIPVQDAGGDRATLGLGEVLRQAHQWRHLADSSPLVNVGIHRLLVAILQDAVRPQRDAEVADLWRQERLPAAELEAFERAYAGCFELFAADRPFLQSADLALAPEKEDRVKSVLCLHPDWPAGGEATHYRHGPNVDAGLCPACAAAGLVVQPAFATSGGSGIKPSINGVPPLYVLPQGETLAQSLIASLVTPADQPNAADRDEDHVWWRHGPTVGHKDERMRVGYLHSLTFPARRMRLHPTLAAGERCTRCGAGPEWLVRTMVYDMGESRTGGAEFWQDPFAAYKLRKGGAGEPIPLRPQEGRALWRDYAALFLSPAASASQGTIRPRILDQANRVAERAGIEVDETLRVHCVGMRTDMKAKVFEWVDQRLEVPFALLHDASAAFVVEAGLDFAENAQRTICFVWAKHFEGGRSGRHRGHRARMVDRYWAMLSAAFDRYVLDCAHASRLQHADEAMERVQRDWAIGVSRAAQEAFDWAADQLGDDAAALRQRVQGQTHCRALLIKRRKEFIPDDR